MFLLARERENLLRREPRCPVARRNFNKKLQRVLSGGAMPQRQDFATTKEYFDAIVRWRSSRNNPFLDDEESDDEDDGSPTCTICSDSVKDEDIYFECDQCHYRFHEACICRWFRKPVLSVNADTDEEFESGTHNECPNCRHAYDANTIIRICGITPEENTHKLVVALVKGKDAIVKECLRYPIVFDMDLEEHEQLFVDAANAMNYRSTNYSFSHLKQSRTPWQFDDVVEHSKVLTVCGMFRPKWLRTLLPLFLREERSHNNRRQFNLVALGDGFPVLHCMLWNCMADEITQLFKVVRDVPIRQHLVDRVLDFVCKIIKHPRHTTRRFVRSVDALLKEMSAIPARDRRTQRQIARGDLSAAEGVTELAYQLERLLRVRNYRGRKAVTVFYSEDAKVLDLLKVFVEHGAPLELVDPIRLLRNKPDNVALLKYFAQLDQRHSNFAKEAGGLSYQSILETAIEKPVPRNIVGIVKICLRNGATYRKRLPANAPQKQKLAKLFRQQKY
ncbi:MAG: hypothetical protein CL450_09085 [Acidimicrobiaceae bacterium]|nr:hypothetical protein [Acidimicrobiaceae bacterium]|tara:strand:- start:2151 stop:3662 length:1512 start_codon:yes stop_codon:yes gene_type:complete